MKLKRTVPEILTAGASGRRGWARMAVAAVAAAAVLRLWILPMVNSYWLDETLIVSIIRDGVGQIVHNAPATQSIAFCWLEWIVSQLFGLNEVSLRLLSVLASLASLYVYYRIGAEFMDQETGVIFVGLCLALPQMVHEAPNVRPYSLALWAEAAALLWLLRWLRSGRYQSGLLWVLCSVAACHMHHLFVIPLAIESSYVLYWALRGGPISVRQTLANLLLGFVALLPAFPQAIAMSRQGASLAFAEVPKFTALATTISLFYLLTPVALMALLAWIAHRPLRWVKLEKGTDVVILGCALLFVPLFGLFALSRLTSLRLFDERYLLSAVPGLILLWGRLLRAVEPPFFRRTSVALGLMVSLALPGGLLTVVALGSSVIP
ncbi:MAG TPA: glycosyltransferase family 39 protein, partial [Bryobacteraceae bacterium]|nr:glycosyltransferase family 39 protein [Bryobacteraceae bacterium]